MKKHREKLGFPAFYKIGIASFAAFGFLVFSFFNLPIIKTANAANSVTTEVNVNISPVITLTVAPELDLGEVTPESSTGTFVSKGITAYVTTNSTSGYALSMYAKGKDASMQNLNNPSAKIPSDFTGSVTSSSMAPNKWGYSLNNTDFYAVPLVDNAVTIRNTDTIAANEGTTVYYGANVSTSTPNGVYEKTVVFTAYPKSDYVDPSERTIFDIHYMQEMTSTICSNTKTPSVDAKTISWIKTDDENLVPRTKLIDSRDGMTYLVSKLADGNCWMSQNLELDLDNEPLTSADTDLNTKASWTAKNHTLYPTETDWDYTDWANDVDRSIKPDVDKKFHLGGTTPSPSPTSTSSDSAWERTGNYYNWIAMTAGHSEAETGVVNDSICPKGWRLPLRTGDKSYYHLINDVYQTKVISDWSQGYEIITVNNPIEEAPLNFTYSGMLIAWPRNIQNDGTFAAYWTAEATSNAANAYGFAVSYPGIVGNTDTVNYKQDAGPIRCVAR